MQNKERLAFFLPNTFTALNMACGFMGFILASQGKFYQGCMLVVLGAIFDSVDGRVARMTGTQSSFGEQFDSMSDLISFGVAPALIFYYRFLDGTGRVGLIFTFFYILCGALRLARFNANIEKVSSDYFQGLPIPGSALGIISYVLFSVEFPQYTENKYLCFAYLFLYSFLMISNIPFPSGKKTDFVKKHKRKILFVCFMMILSLAVYEEMMILALISLYTVLSITYWLVNFKKFDGIFEWDD